MKSQLSVVGLGGSLAKHSSSLAALKIALQGAEEAAAKTSLPDIREPSLPLYDPADETMRIHLLTVLEMCEAIRQSTAQTDLSAAAQCTTAQSAAHSRMRSTG